MKPLDYNPSVMRLRFDWSLGPRALALGERTLIMGVLNVTPDSFSDGGLYLDSSAAVAYGLRLLEEGADILDVGGESTRPGARVKAEVLEHGSETRATQVPNVRTFVTEEEEELRRVIPVIRELKQRRPEAVISVDTYKAAVARAAVEAGAEIVNDVSGFQWDPHMAAAVAELRCGVVLMHTRGRPEDWRSLPPVKDIVAVVSGELQQRAKAARDAGVAREHIVLDPGFGFGKNYEENYPLLRRFEKFQGLGFPLLAGPSRKSFIGCAMARGGVTPPPNQRLAGSLAAAVIAIMKGAHIVRVHDVKEAVEAAAVADLILSH